MLEGGLTSAGLEGPVGEGFWPLGLLGFDTVVPYFVGLTLEGLEVDRIVTDVTGFGLLGFLTGGLV